MSRPHVVVAQAQAQGSHAAHPAARHRETISSRRYAPASNDSERRLPSASTSTRSQPANLARPRPVSRAELSRCGLSRLSAQAMSAPDPGATATGLPNPICPSMCRDSGLPAGCSGRIRQVTRAPLGFGLDGVDGLRDRSFPHLCDLVPPPLADLPQVGAELT